MQACREENAEILFLEPAIRIGFDVILKGFHLVRSAEGGHKCNCVLMLDLRVAVIGSGRSKDDLDNLEACTGCRCKGAVRLPSLSAHACC